MTLPARLFALLLICLLAVPVIGVAAPALPEAALAEYHPGAAPAPGGDEPQPLLPATAAPVPGPGTARAPFTRARRHIGPVRARRNRHPSHAPPAPASDPV